MATDSARIFSVTEPVYIKCFLPTMARHRSSQFIFRTAACDYVCFVVIVFDVTLKLFTQLSNGPIRIQFTNPILFIVFLLLQILRECEQSA